MHKSIIASGGALMDKSIIATRQLISNMAENYKQFGTKIVAPSRVIASEVFLFYGC